MKPHPKTGVRVFGTALGVVTFSLVFVPHAMAVAPRGACQVSDPSPTPLNVRSVPRGKVVRTLAYETIVYKTGKVAADRAKKTWVQVSLEKSGPAIGWVYREYITCRV